MSQNLSSAAVVIDALRVKQIKTRCHCGAKKNEIVACVPCQKCNFLL